MRLRAVAGKEEQEAKGGSAFAPRVLVEAHVWNAGWTAGPYGSALWASRGLRVDVDGIGIGRSISATG